MKVLLAIATLLGIISLASHGQLAPSALSTFGTPAKVTTPTPSSPSMAYRELLKRLYSTVSELKENPSEWPADAVANEVASIRAALANTAATPERESALRLCTIGERLNTLTAPFIKRYEQTTARAEVRNRSYEEQARAEKDAEAKDTAFKANVVRQWREQAGPFQSAAKLAWNSIPETAAFASDGVAAVQSKRLEEKSTWHPVVVERVLKDGAFVVPMDSYAIASRGSRVGLGGNVGTGWRPGNRIIFAKGLTGVAETQRWEILFHKDGTHTYRDEFGEVRTVEKWAVLKSRGE